MAAMIDMMSKMCLIGEAEVGKTSLIRRFVIDKYDEKYIATIGSKTSKKTMTIKGDGVDVNLKLMIWDILGQRSFARLQKVAYNGAKGAFIVLDLTRKDTLDSFDNWLFSLYKVTGEIPVVVLVNKNDLEPEFGESEIQELLKDYGFPYYYTSAKTGEKVNEAFFYLGETMVKLWTGMKKEPTSEVPRVLERYLETEMELGRKLTALEVEDMIVARYCDVLEDTDFAMAVVREQFKRAGLDLAYPTVDGLTKVADYLIEAASNLVEDTRLKKEGRIYMKLIRRIG